MGPNIIEDLLGILKISDAERALLDAKHAQETQARADGVAELLAFLLGPIVPKQTLANEVPTKSERPYLRLLK